MNLKSWGTLLFFLSCSPLSAWTLLSSGIGGWQTHRLTVHVNPTNCPLDSDALNTLIDDALDTWNHIASANIVLVRDPTPSTTTVASFLAQTATDSPVITCDPNFAANNNGNPDEVPASTRVNTQSGGVINYGGTVLNAQAGAGAEISALTSDQLVVTIAHELGHVMGLGHSGLSDALMYFSINGKTRPILTQDDIDGMTYLYPRNEFSAAPFGCGAVHGARSPASLIWVAITLGLLLLGGRVVRRYYPTSGICTTS